MLLITKRQKDRLKEYLPELADTLIAGNEINPIIDELDDLVISLLDENCEPTAESRVVERFMDDLIWQNLHPEDFPVYDGKKGLPEDEIESIELAESE